jgi:hypothetical protein
MLTMSYYILGVTKEKKAARKSPVKVRPEAGH